MNMGRLDDDFKEDVRARGESDSPLILDLDGFEGPLDLLLSMARARKVDLLQISISILADQYISYMEHMREADLEIAADYLVMAAWLAYMKSRLLLPTPVEDDEPVGEEMAAVLTYRLRRYEAMKQVASKLMARPQLGRDVFGQGNPLRLETDISTAYPVTLHDLLQAYGDCQRESEQRNTPLRVVPTKLYSVHDALMRLKHLLNTHPDGFDLRVLLEDRGGDSLMRRSVLASGLAAGLELVRNGQATIHQEYLFGPVQLCEGRQDD